MLREMVEHSDEFFDMKKKNIHFIVQFAKRKKNRMDGFFFMEALIKDEEEYQACSFQGLSRPSLMPFKVNCR